MGGGHGGGGAALRRVRAAGQLSCCRSHTVLLQVLHRADDMAPGEVAPYRVRLEDNRHRWDCAYPGVEVLGDGTIVATTYGYWAEGEVPWILSVRFTLEELDARVRATP